MIIEKYHENVKLKFCTYEAAYTSSYMKHSNAYDDVLIPSDASRMLPTFYTVGEDVCSDIWSNKQFKLPGLGDEQFVVPIDITRPLLQNEEERSYIVDHARTFMVKGGRKGIGYACTNAIGHTCNEWRM